MYCASRLFRLQLRIRRHTTFGGCAAQRIPRNWDKVTLGRFMNDSWQNNRMNGGPFHAAHAEPEILPPDPGIGTSEEQRQTYYYQPPPPQPVPPQPSRSRWAYAPATYILVGINCLVFLGMAFSGVSIVAPTPEQLLNWGADYGPYVLLLGEWWRLLTATFVHVGILHLATNMWCLWNLGLLGEPLVGPLGVFAAYILSGAAGNLLSIGVNLAFRSDSVGAGASGAVFGIAGVLIVLLKSPRLPIPPKELSGLRKYVIYFAAINFVIGFGSLAVGSVVHIDNM